MDRPKWTRYADIPEEVEKAQRGAVEVDKGARRDDERGFVFEVKPRDWRRGYFRAEARVRGPFGATRREHPFELTELTEAQAWVDAQVEEDDRSGGPNDERA